MERAPISQFFAYKCMLLYLRFITLKFKKIYLSSEVKYEIVGKDLLVTTLNENDVRMRVNVPLILFCASFESITNNVKDKIVIKKLNE